MPPILSLIFGVVCFAVAIVAGVNYIRHRQEKKRKQQEQYIKDKDGEEMM